MITKGEAQVPNSDARARARDAYRAESVLMRDVAAHWDRLELAGRGELLYATGVPLPLRHQPAGQDLRQLSSPRHGIDLSLRCSHGLVSAELVIDLGAGADLAAAERVRDSQLDHHCQLLRELLDIQMDGCQWLTAAGRAPVHLSAPQPLPRALWSRAMGGLSAARALDPFSAGGDAHAHPPGAARWWTHRDTTPHVLYAHGTWSAACDGPQAPPSFFDSGSGGGGAAGGLLHRARLAWATGIATADGIAGARLRPSPRTTTPYQPPHPH